MKLLFAKFKRFILISLGLICLVLGIIGYFLPGLPGTIWLIIAATLFVRSSDRLYRFVVQHRLFGKQVKQFLDTGSMTLRAKIVSMTFMWIFSITSVFFAPYGLMFDIPVLALAVVGTIFISSRPTLKFPQ